MYVMFGRSAYVKRRTVLYNTGSWLNLCAVPDSLHKSRHDGVQSAHSGSASPTCALYTVTPTQMVQPWANFRRWPKILLENIVTLLSSTSSLNI